MKFVTDNFLLKNGTKEKSVTLAAAAVRHGRPSPIFFLSFLES